MLLSRRLSPNVERKLAFLLESQYWPYAKLKEYQWSRLLHLLSFASRTVPYYRALFKKHGIDITSAVTPKDIATIPILTRAAIRANFHALISDQHDTEQLFLNSTGGSTGEPLIFYQDRNQLEWHEAAMFRAWKDMVGCKFGDLEAVLWGAERDIGKGMPLLRVLRTVIRERQLALNTFDLDSRLIHRFLLFYNILRPPILRGYSSSLYYFARFIHDNRLQIHYPSAVISSAEMLWPEMRKTVEAVFRSRVFDSYGSREVSQIATECNAHSGLHVVMENQYVEIVSNAILVTNLNNFAMPLIRYAIGDGADRIEAAPCPCGRESERLLGLRGRESEMILLHNGKMIHGEYFSHLFYGTDDVDAFEIVFKKKSNELVIRCNGLSATRMDFLRSQLDADFGLQKVAFERLECMQKTSSGKYKFINVVDA